MAISRILDTTIRRNHAKQLSASFLTVRGRQGNFRRFSQAPDTLPSLQQRASHDLNEINFRYTPLRAPGGEGSSDPKAFRLVELLPGATTDPIRCRLREVDVEVTEKYEALSYCWGNPKDRSTIECNGKQLLIPSNLAAALQGLRLTASSRHLWADAVCIDQADPSDKALQVPRMRSIYSLSQRTLIWLGTMGDSNAPSISPASKMAVRLAPLLALASRRTSLKIGTVDIRTGRRGQLSPFSGAFYLAMVHILRRPWFRRAWVVQEAAVSRKATILFDHIEYDWDEIVAALKFLSRVKFPLGFLSSPQHMAAVDHERNLYAKGGGSLPGLLIRHQRCLATDQRDKIFAFAGLLNPAAAERDVRITYTDSPETVYRELATMIMARDENLDILSRPPAIGSSRLESGIPSWVPDWSVTPNPHLSYTWSLGPPSLAETEARDGLGQTCRFAASGGSRYKPEISGTLCMPSGTRSAPFPTWVPSFQVSSWPMKSVACAIGPGVGCAPFAPSSTPTTCWCGGRMLQARGTAAFISIPGRRSAMPSGRPSARANIAARSPSTPPCRAGSGSLLG